MVSLQLQLVLPSALATVIVSPSILPDRSLPDSALVVVPFPFDLSADRRCSTHRPAGRPWAGPVNWPLPKAMTWTPAFVFSAPLPWPRYSPWILKSGLWPPRPGR